MCWLSEALIESRQFIRWLHRWRPYIASLYWRTPHLLLRFICLHEGAILPLLLRFFWPDFVRFLLGFLRLHFCDCSSGTLFSSWWSAMEYRRCQLPCPLYITSDGPHSNCVKCMGFSHTPEVVYGISKCKLFENFISKPSALGWQFLRGSPEAVEAFREFRTWGSVLKLKAMENEQTGLAHSLPLSPEHVYVNSPVEYFNIWVFIS